jgi:hypothetical protein
MVWPPASATLGDDFTTLRGAMFGWLIKRTLRVINIRYSQRYNFQRATFSDCMNAHSFLGQHFGAGTTAAIERVIQQLEWSQPIRSRTTAADH